MTPAIIALLGRRDAPTDGVEEYCGYLGEALRGEGFEFKLVRADWKGRGWTEALGELKEQCASWRGQWVLVQYTALAWSSRGFPMRFRNILKILRQRGARLGVVFHDAEPYAGSRLIDRIRRAAQLRTMRGALRFADLAIFTIPLDRISWLREAPAQAVFIPVGANLPLALAVTNNRPARAGEALRIAIYGITGGKSGQWESEEIVKAVRAASAKIPRLQLFAFGRGADDCAMQLCEGLRGFPVEVSVEGVLPAERVARELALSDVLFFVRGQISSRRGSAIAGIACGLPIIAIQGSETAPPITEAGVVLVAPGDSAGLGEALTRVLADERYRASLADRSAMAQQKYFSWMAIASRFAEELRAHDKPSSE